MKTKTELLNELPAKWMRDANLTTSYLAERSYKNCAIEITAILALPDATVSVPEVAREDMLKAGAHARFIGGDTNDVYNAMIAAHLESLK